jgi:hypothetical protein
MYVFLHKVSRIRLSIPVSGIPFHGGSKVNRKSFSLLLNIPSAEDRLPLSRLFLGKYLDKSGAWK